MILVTKTSDQTRQRLCVCVVLACAASNDDLLVALSWKRKRSLKPRGIATLPPLVLRPSRCRNSLKYVLVSVLRYAQQALRTTLPYQVENVTSSGCS